ncbi:hypothetical protein MKEN_00100400 [Mycena kentingensis (nom. inval.)]|nr:hypothetical protein MKEN_00100400 [Mycena kentingensis (nom. inval.)]
MKTLNSALNGFHRNVKKIETRPDIMPEDDAVIFFTSGTTGLPKGVLSTQRQYLTNTMNTIVARRRALLRKGEEIPVPSIDDPQQGFLISVPLFHVTGTTSMTMSATFIGAKIVFLRKWHPQEAARLIRQENLTNAGGVPSMSADLIESELAGYEGLDGLSFGGATTAAVLTQRAVKAFPNATITQGYGMTECNSIATSVAGDDWHARPTTAGYPSPITDIAVVKDSKVVPTGDLGEIWIKGCNVMKGYWRDQAATDRTITKDGWLMTGDIGFQDSDGFVYVRDRIKDIIIRGGENIDSTTVENALFIDGVTEVAAVAVPDKRLGELVAAVVVAKPEANLTEESLLAVARARLPAFAVPVMILFRKEMEHNPAGKIMKPPLRRLAAAEWVKKKANRAKL